MTTTATLTDDRDCTGCGARAGSCGIRKWLAGRPCCETCDHGDDPDQEA